MSNKKVFLSFINCRGFKNVLLNGPGKTCFLQKISQFLTKKPFPVVNK